MKVPQIPRIWMCIDDLEKNREAPAELAAG
jgi:hypothetical protein